MKKQFISKMIRTTSVLMTAWLLAPSMYSAITGSIYPLEFVLEENYAIVKSCDRNYSGSLTIPESVR